MVHLDDLKAAEEKIRALAEAALATGRPYLLSKLGNDLGPELNTIRSVGASLADFIRSRLSHEYDIVLTGQHNNIQALVRAGEEIRGPILPPTQDVGAHKPPRFHYRFWAAFSVPLLSGTRYIDMNNFTFVDTDEEPEGNYAIIEAEFIAPAEADKRDALILQNIERWCAKSGFSIEQFHSKPRDKEPLSAKSVSGRSLLEVVIDALDNRQLSGTTLTLDVVAALFRRRL